jgi:hypothetical protein
VNPPKPERESNRRRKKKSLAEDFIDITDASSLYLLDYSNRAGKAGGGTAGRSANSSKSGNKVTATPTLMEPSVGGVQLKRKIQFYCS